MRHFLGFIILLSYPFLSAFCLEDPFYCKVPINNLYALAQSDSYQRYMSIPQFQQRIAQGFGKSPYSFFPTLRYLTNLATNGYFSYQNPDSLQMKLLGQNGSLVLNNQLHKNNVAPVKIIFLGDYMVSKSGQPPTLSEALANYIQSADVIVVNVEAPFVQATHSKRTFCLRFGMSISYLQALYNYHPQAQWVFNIANNHAFDTSDASSEDISGLLETINIIKKHIPSAHIVGADRASARSVVVVPLGNLRIGIVGWTDVMNNDALHIQKPIVRGQDVTPLVIEEVKNNLNLDVLMGFPHGNEEQSYYPLKQTRDRWVNLVGAKLFDVIVGTGPHVIQPAEEINERIIFHSIGNFFSPMGSTYTKLGCIPSVTIVPNSENIRLDYDIHFGEQDGQVISLCNIEDSKPSTASSIGRLKTIWPTLFGHEFNLPNPMNYKKITALITMTGLATYYLYKNFWISNRSSRMLNS